MNRGIRRKRVHLMKISRLHSMNKIRCTKKKIDRKILFSFTCVFLYSFMYVYFQFLCVARRPFYLPTTRLSIITRDRCIWQWHLVNIHETSAAHWTMVWIGYLFALVSVLLRVIRSTANKWKWMQVSRIVCRTFKLVDCNRPSPETSTSFLNYRIRKNVSGESRWSKNQLIILFQTETLLSVELDDRPSPLIWSLLRSNRITKLAKICH